MTDGANGLLEERAKEIREWFRMDIMRIHGLRGEEYILEALQAAYQKGAEEMRERAAEVVIKEHKTCEDWGCEISNKILSLPLTEGGAR